MECFLSGGRTKQSMKKTLISMVTKVKKNFKNIIAAVQKIKDSYRIYINYLILFLSEKYGICLSGLYCIFLYAYRNIGRTDCV